MQNSNTKTPNFSPIFLCFSASYVSIAIHKRIKRCTDEPECASDFHQLSSRSHASLPPLSLPPPSFPHSPSHAQYSSPPFHRNHQTRTHDIRPHHTQSIIHFTHSIRSFKRTINHCHRSAITTVDTYNA